MYKTIQVGVCLASILAFAPGQGARAQTTSSSVEPTTVFLAPEEAKFFSLINSFRRKLGLNELRIHADLQRAALKHSKWMATQDAATGQAALTHSGPTPDMQVSDRVDLEGFVGYTSIGENIACGSATAVETFRQFAFSPPHLRNMLNPRYRHMGISRAGTGREDCPYYWTNDFGSKEDPSTDLPAVDFTNVDRIAAAIESVSRPGNTGPSADPTLARVTSGTIETQTGYTCVVPYTLGRGALVSTADTQTTVEVRPQADTMLLKLSYQQANSDARFSSYTVSGVALVKNPFYPLVTLFSAPTSRFGGFMIQIDTASGRAQFDPYPGTGGKSGLISCRLQ